MIAGAPNIVRGGSHSGNVAAGDLLDAGAVDAFASDYVPPSLVEAAFRSAPAIGLPAAITMITDTPAGMAGLADRGRLDRGCGPMLSACGCMKGCRSCDRSGAAASG